VGSFAFQVAWLESALHDEVPGHSKGERNLPCLGQNFKQSTGQSYARTLGHCVEYAGAENQDPNAMMLEFTDTEITTIRELLVQRYQKDIEIHLADSDMTLDGEDEIREFPTVFWHARGANFILIKTGMFGFRAQFFYTPHEQFDTGVDEYNALAQCVSTVLEVQAEHEKQRLAEHTDLDLESLN